MISVAPRAKRSAGLRVRAEDDIRAIDPERWDAILHPDDLLATHRFVRTCQESRIEMARYRHLLIEDAGGPLAIASLSAMEFRVDLLAPGWVRRGAESVRRSRPRFLRSPLVIGGLPVSFNASCLRLRPGARADRVLRLIDREAADLARSTGSGIICFKEFTDAETESAGGLRELGYFRAPSLPSCRLDLPHVSFEAYLASMRAGYRRQARATLRVRRDHGLLVRATSARDANPPELHRLYSQVMDRAEYQLERLGPEFFEALGRNLPETEAILVEHEGRLLAHAILAHGRTRSHFLLTGIDYARNREHHAYLNVVLEVVARCLERGAQSVELGQTSWALKARLGAVATRRHLFFRHANPILHRALRAARPVFFPEYSVPERRVFRHEFDRFRSVLSGVRPAAVPRPPDRGSGAGSAG